MGWGWKEENGKGQLSAVVDVLLRSAYDFYIDYGDFCLLLRPSITTCGYQNAG